jgi:hypothetical protein
MTMRAIHTQQKMTTLNFRGRVIASNQKPTALISKQNDIDFINFDLDRMKKAVDAKSYVVPNTLNNFDDFDAWLNQL